MAIVLDGTAGITTPDLTDTSLTSGRVVYAGTSGNLTGSANLGFDGTNLGIGTSSPTRSLTIEKSGAAFPSSSNPSIRLNELVSGRFAVIELDSSQNLNIWNGNSTTASIRFYRDSGSGTLSMVIDSSGNLGLGTSSPAINGIDIVRSAGTSTYLSTSDGVYTAFYGVAPALGGAWLGSTTNVPLLINTNGTERARIDTSGNLLVATTTKNNDGRLSISADSATHQGISIKDLNGANNLTYILFTNSSANTAGTITHTGSTTVSYNTSSDYRLKENIAPMTGALARVAQLKPVTYTWKEDGKVGQGFIAHELQEVVPDCVTGEKDAVYADGLIKPQGIDTSFLVATLTAAIQEQQALITTLTERITALEGA
jgi:hypothetical protein